jgi:hypothetical protein
MSKKATLIGGAVAAVLLLPGVASAEFLLDTGTPTGTGGPAVLNSSSWVAAEFNATAGEDITALSAYLMPGAGAGQLSNTFTFDIYSSTNFTGRANLRSVPASFAGSYTADGWNTTAVNWIVPTTGEYWLALQVAPTGQTNGLDLPQETSDTTGTEPAIAFARLTGSGTSSEYTTAGALPVGLEVTASPVPLPPGLLLLGSGLLGLGVMSRAQHSRKRA